MKENTVVVTRSNIRLWVFQ